MPGKGEAPPGKRWGHRRSVASRKLTGAELNRTARTGARAAAGAAELTGELPIELIVVRCQVERQERREPIRLVAQPGGAP